MRLFTNSLSGTFVSRPNRFVVEVETSKGLVRAHCPNPGRLTEILVPGRSLILERSETACRALPYTLAAARYRGKIIPLVSVKANAVAERFVVPRLYPEGSVIRREAVHGGSRFDFMVTDGTTSGYVEVKSCTLCEYGRGMFPDAPTTRGERHVRELAGLSVSGLRGDALFMVSHPDVSVFSPNIHTDPEFSRTLLCVRETVGLHAWKYSVDEEGTVEGAEEIPVDL